MRDSPPSMMQERRSPLSTFRNKDEKAYTNKTYK